MASDIIERWKASAQRQLCLPLLPFIHARKHAELILKQESCAVAKMTARCALYK